MRSWYLAGLLLAAAGLSFWLKQRLAIEQLPTPTAVRIPDYFLGDMVRRVHDTDGRLRSVLRTERLEHFADDDSSTLVRPRMELYNDSEWSWFAQSESGWVSAGAKTVLLHGPVEIRRVNAAGEVRVEVFTSELRVQPDDQFAETDRPATIRMPRGFATGIGMRANLADNRLQLLEQVTSHYDNTD